MKTSIKWQDPKWRVGFLRVHEEGDYGAPWSVSCAVVDKGDGKARLEIVSGAPSASEARSLIRELHEQGFDVVWDRANVKLARTTGLPRGARFGVNSQETHMVSKAAEPQDGEMITVHFILIAGGNMGFNDSTIKVNTVNRAKYEELQRAISGGLFGMQKTAQEA